MTNIHRTFDEVPDVTLERYQLGELPMGDMAFVRTRLRGDAHLAHCLAALERSDDEIRRRYPSDQLAHAIRTRVLDRQAGRRVGVGRTVARWMAPAGLAAAAALLLLIVRLDTTGSPAAPPAAAALDEDRIKGLQPSLAVFRKTVAGSETLVDGGRARTGDVIRVGYRAAGREYGLIVSVDGRGTITRHLPPDGLRAMRLSPGAIVLLDRAYELDDAPKWERFYFVTGHAPFDAAAVLTGVRAGAAAPDDSASVLTLPPALEYTTFLLRKEDHP